MKEKKNKNLKQNQHKEDPKLKTTSYIDYTNPENDNKNYRLGYRDQKKDNNPKMTSYNDVTNNYTKESL